MVARTGGDMAGSHRLVYSLGTVTAKESLPLGVRCYRFRHLGGEGLCVPHTLRTLDKRVTGREAGRRVAVLYWLMKHVFLGPLLRLFFRPEVEGAENIPDKGGAILASNHLAVADSFFLPLMLKRRVTFPAKLEYFTQPGVKGRLKKWFFSGMGQIPIDRSGGPAAQAALATATPPPPPPPPRPRRRRAARRPALPPEAPPPPAGRLYKGKTGLARMVLDSG